MLHTTSGRRAAQRRWNPPPRRCRCHPRTAQIENALRDGEPAEPGARRIADEQTRTAPCTAQALRTRNTFTTRVVSDALAHGIDRGSGYPATNAAHALVTSTDHVPAPKLDEPAEAGAALHPGQPGTTPRKLPQKDVTLSMTDHEKTPARVSFPDLDAGQYVPLGALVARVRNMRGLSQVAVQQRAGMKASTLSKIERGDNGINGVASIIKLADALRIPREQLFEWAVRYIENRNRHDTRRTPR
ncbi:helix-turn-helix domain-containing protein [Amycolatopsis alba]|uniref:XRE family transcriptional regulator n=1 Tax=Amycolatopsis alba DSM 44262 TaxID=1125972 RepID=A0A229R907_AMYAL|nr:helix-turn-helix domain-containing protein [Amycolatopsis alba]OXM43140.1 XRE family transcriptional regulator [Amycolatopsis alba DSM 44262]